MGKRYLEIGSVCHVYNRGVEKRIIFADDEDRFRFIHDLFEFNDEKPTVNTLYYLRQNNILPHSGQHIEVRLPYIEREPRGLLVEILAFVMMPNHFHLMLRQIRESGITEFMRKLGTGYTNYFNKKYERVGHLLQGKYKVSVLQRDAHFIHLPYYIHTNPIDLLLAEKNGRASPGEMIRFLECYRWSSFPDYIGKNNFSSVTQRDFLLQSLGNKQECLRSMRQWLREREANVKVLAGVALDV